MIKNKEHFNDLSEILEKIGSKMKLMFELKKAEKDLALNNVGTIIKIFDCIIKFVVESDYFNTNDFINIGDIKISFNEKYYIIKYPIWIDYEVIYKVIKENLQCDDFSLYEKLIGENVLMITKSLNCILYEMDKIIEKSHCNIKSLRFTFDVTALDKAISEINEGDNE